MSIGSSTEVTNCEAIKGIPLCCPRCHGFLASRHRCQPCGISYPVVGTRPILINEDNSAFRLEEVRNFAFMGMHQPQSVWMRILPTPDRNTASKPNFERVAGMLPAHARILVLGAANGGSGTEAVYKGDFAVVSSDVWPGAVVDVILDAHDIPFPDESFDCVIAQAVLEHVADPYRCVSEIQRVLRPEGIVYAETPFMQQVHGGEYDFCRFTHLGHRRLFRWFSVIDSGIVAGPGMSLAWAWEYFWMSFVNRRGPVRKLLRGLSRLTSFWMPWCDALLTKRLGAFDAASGFYFMGRRTARPLSDRDLLAEFRGVR